MVDAPMSLERLRVILDAYGAHPQRWPAAERSAAQRLLEVSAQARAWRDASAKLDGLLDQAELPAASARLASDILDAVSRAASAAPTARLVPISGGRSSSRRGALRRVVSIAAPLAAAAGLALWLNSLGTGEPVASQHASIGAAEIGTYDAPTDVFLATPQVEELDWLPAFGCEDDGLGCLDADLDPSTVDQEELV